MAGLAEHKQVTPWKAPPFQHQEIILDHHLKGPHTGDGSDVGVGKTPPMVTCLSELMRLGRIRRALVVCPNTIMDNWAKEIAAWSDLPSIILRGPREKRIALLQQKGSHGIWIINYEATWRFLSYLLAMDFNAVVCDEIHHAKDPRAQQTKAVLELGRRIGVRKAMTGTLLTNSLLDVWAPAQFISPNIFKTNFWGFRNRYLYDVNAGKSWLKFPDWQPRPGAVEEVKRLLSPWFIRFEKKEVLKFLPPVLFQRRDVEMGDEQKRVDNDLKRYYLAELNDGVVLTAPQILTRIEKRLQITGGFTYLENGKPYHFKPNPKIEELKNLLDEIGEHRVVVWAAYREEIAMLKETLPSSETIFGDTKREERQPLVDRFNHGEFQYLICNPGVASEGLTILAPYAIWYSRGWKLLHRTQSLGRHDRPGAEQFDNLTMIDLVARESMDEKVIGALDKKEDLLHSVTPESFRRMLE